jgi:hypothetical protein
VGKVSDDGGAFQGWESFASQLEWALAYARFGLAVFPVAANKHPIYRLAPHGFKSASRDPAIIADWWTERPHADPAIAIGADMVVADADASHAQRGIADLERLAGVSIVDIPAPCAQTRTGGRHVWFASQGRRYVNKRLPGAAVDVKNLGGYVVAPGYQNGRFWLKPLWEVPLPPAPAWLNPLLKREPLVLASRAAFALPAADDPWARKQALQVLDRACERIVATPCGERDNTRHAQCFFIGGLVERGDLDYPTAYAALLASARAVAHDPPWRNLEDRVANSIAAGMKRPLALSETDLFMRNLRARMRARRPA